MSLLAASVANAFLAKAEAEGKLLTNMQVQKLVFIAHGFYLAFFDTSLIEEEVKAWQWGPVIPPLYNKLKKHGSGIIPGRIPDVPTVPPGSQMDVINQVWKSYGSLTGSQLSSITHQADAPWTQIWETAPFAVIPKDLIRLYYWNQIQR